MNKNILRYTVLLLIALYIFVLSGCKKKDSNIQVNNDEYSPVSSLSASESEVAALSGKTRAALYYITQRGDSVAAEMKLLDFTASDRRTENLALKIMHILLESPSNSNLQKTIPDGTIVNSVKVNKGVATVDFNDAFTAGLPSSKNLVSLIICSIVNTLTEFKEINTVTLTVNGKAISSPAGICFTLVERDASVITDIGTASAPNDYSESVFANTPLE